LQLQRKSGLTGSTAASEQFDQWQQWAVSDTSEFLRLKDAAVVDPVGLGSHGGEMGCRESRAGGQIHSWIFTYQSTTGVPSYDRIPDFSAYFLLLSAIL
jgi:hypothetical protein